MSDIDQDWVSIGDTIPMGLPPKCTICDQRYCAHLGNEDEAPRQVEVCQKIPDEKGIWIARFLGHKLKTDDKELAALLNGSSAPMESDVEDGWPRLLEVARLAIAAVATLEPGEKTVHFFDGVVWVEGPTTSVNLVTSERFHLQPTPVDQGAT